MAVQATMVRVSGLPRPHAGEGLFCSWFTLFVKPELEPGFRLIIGLGGQNLRDFYFFSGFCGSFGRSLKVCKKEIPSRSADGILQGEAAGAAQKERRGASENRRSDGDRFRGTILREGGVGRFDRIMEHPGLRVFEVL